MSVLQKLALFPLGLVLYPGERLPLHIFESRYKMMIQHCLEVRRPFGIVLFEEGHMADVGCTARVSRILNRYEDGRMDILVQGEQRFRVGQVYAEEPYLTADVEPIEEPDVPVDRGLKERVITQHIRLLELAGRTVRPSLYENVREISYVLAPNAGLSSKQKQELLEMLTEKERIAYLADHFKALLPRVEQLEEVRRKIQSNGHFKDLPPGDA